MTVWSPPSPLMTSRDFDNLLGVESHSRLVEDEHFWLVDEGLGQADALPVALGQVADHRVSLVGNAGLFHGVVDPAVESRAGHAFDLGDKAQIGVYRHIVVERRLLGQIADALAHLHGLFDNVETSDLGFALRRRQITGKYAHRRGLARAIRPEGNRG